MQMIGSIRVRLGFDQKAVDQVRLESRLGGAGDDQQLIDVGDQHVLPAAALAAERAVPRLDPLDDSFGGRRRLRGRNHTRSPATTTCRWSVAKVLSSAAWRIETAARYRPRPGWSSRGRGARDRSA